MSGIDNLAPMDCSTPERLSVSCSKNHLLPTSQSDSLSVEQAGPKITSSASEISGSLTGTDKLCDWGNFHPFCLQTFCTPQWVLFWLFWAGALQGLIVNGFINVVTATIEKRYELKSTETGLIAGSYDIASFLCLIPVSYFGGSRSKPFFIGSGLIILAFGSLEFSLPYFLAGPYTFSQEQDFHCHPGLSTSNYSISCSQDDSSLSNYKYVFFIGQLLHGAGAVSSSLYSGLYFYR